MLKHRRTLVILNLLLSLCVLTPAAAQGNVQTVRTFANCTQMHTVYRGGVALPGAVNSGGKTRYSPKYSRKLYRANSKMDRDKDGIACEA
jgi:hypothetical protein